MVRSTAAECDRALGGQERGRRMQPTLGGEEARPRNATAPCLWQHGLGCARAPPTCADAGTPLAGGVREVRRPSARLRSSMLAAAVPVVTGVRRLVLADVCRSAVFGVRRRLPTCGAWCSPLHVLDVCRPAMPGVRRSTCSTFADLRCLVFAAPRTRRLPTCGAWCSPLHVLDVCRPAMPGVSRNTYSTFADLRCR